MRITSKLTKHSIRSKQAVYHVNHTYGPPVPYKPDPMLNSQPSGTKEVFVYHTNPNNIFTSAQTNLNPQQYADIHPAVMKDLN